MDLTCKHTCKPRERSVRLLNHKYRVDRCGFWYSSGVADFTVLTAAVGKENKWSKPEAYRQDISPVPFTLPGDLTFIISEINDKEDKETISLCDPLYNKHTAGGGR